MHRIVARQIGDDSNKVAELTQMQGRLVRRRERRRQAHRRTGSGLDGKGEVAVFSYDADTVPRPGIKAILAKANDKRSTEEQKVLDGHTRGVNQADLEKADREGRRLRGRVQAGRRHGRGGRARQGYGAAATTRRQRRQPR